MNPVAIPQQCPHNTDPASPVVGSLGCFVYLSVSYPADVFTNLYMADMGLRFPISFSRFFHGFMPILRSILVTLQDDAEPNGRRHQYYLIVKTSIHRCVQRSRSLVGFGQVEVSRGHFHRCGNLKFTDVPTLMAIPRKA